MKSFTMRILFVVIIAGLTGSSVLASEFCSKNDNGNRNDRYSSSDKREFNLASTGSLEVDGKKNGGIKVVGEDRGDVLVTACVRSWAKSQAEADNLVQTTRIDTGGVIRAENDSEKSHTSVSYQIRVPRGTNLTLKAMNGGLKVDGVDGTMDLRTVNGGIKLSNVSGDIKGRTTNGGVSVGLGGNGWTGNGLDVETVNGGVKISIPSTFAANVEAGTVNGGFKSDFAELQLPKKEGKERSYSRNKRVSASINGGGATIRAVTTNGGVKITSSDKMQ